MYIMMIMMMAKKREKKKEADQSKSVGEPFQKIVCLAVIVMYGNALFKRIEY